MSIFETLKSVANTLKEANKIELYKQILDMQQDFLEMQENIKKLKEENADLKTLLQVKENLIYENNAYWFIKEQDKDGPFCSRCWDKDKTLLRMHPCGNPAYSECPECETRINTHPIPPQFDIEEKISYNF